MLSDDKIVAMISGDNGSPAVDECILNVIIDGGINGINPVLLGDAVLIDKDACPSKTEEMLGKAANVVSKVGGLLGGALGDVADVEIRLLRHFTA